MSASPETKITFELSGSGANPTSMGTTTPTATTTPTSSDTGLFTASDSLSAGSVVIGFSICLLAAVSLVIFKSIKQPKMHAANISKNFNLKKGIFKKFGIFAIFLLASGIILPNFLPEDKSASALIPEGATTVELTAGANGALSGEATLSGTTGRLAFAKETLTCKSACSIYISAATTNNNLNYANDITKGWIAAKSGTKSALSVNTWGYAIDAPATPAATSAIWSVVPAKGNEARIVNNLEAGKSTEITFGAYANNSVPAGSYSNTVVYTAIKAN